MRIGGFVKMKCIDIAEIKEGKWLCKKNAVKRWEKKQQNIFI